MRSRDPFEVLDRIERQALERTRRTLSAINSRQAALEADLAQARAARVREAGVPAADPVLLAHYINRSRAQERALHEALAAVEAERQAQAERLAEQRLAVRRLELLLERRLTRCARERDRRERRALEDVILARHRRPPIES